MWTQPRATLRFLLQQPPHWQWWLPALLLGIAAVFQLTTLQPELRDAPWLQRLTTSVLIGPLSAWFEIVVVAFGLRLSGALWQGRASPRALRLAVTWSQLPNLLAFVLWFIEWQWLGFTATATTTAASVFHALRALLSLYGLLLLTMAVAEVQQFSLRRSTLSIALLFLVFIALLYALKLPVPVS